MIKQRKQYRWATIRELATQRWEGGIQDYRDGWAAYLAGKPRPARYMGMHYRAGWRAARNFMATWASVDERNVA